jgi:hypothetical protein
VTEDNDGGGYIGVFSTQGHMIASGSYSESEDFGWDK